MRRLVSLLLVLTAGTTQAAGPPKPNTLTPEEIADGPILLFDGEATFGWKCEGDVAVKDGELVLGGTAASSVATTSAFAEFQVEFQALCDGRFSYSVRGYEPGVRTPPSWTDIRLTVRNARAGQSIEVGVGRMPPGPAMRLQGIVPTLIAFKVPAGTTLRLRNVKLKPLGLESIFSGKDLTGWKVYSGDANRSKSKFTVTPEGWLNVKNGPGDMQTQGQWADFVFQGECISNGKHLNSGIFFRCLPDQYQQGYEMQIRNQWEGDDRTKPVDFGTGAIYRRQPARKVVSTDGEWFTLTLVAHRNHFATWVNGYPVADWTDTRPENNNARNGLKLGPGPLSIQGHDPTTDLSFRNLRVAELPKKE
jgi:hypothetical protein